YFALLALSVGLQLLRGHTQVAYYTFMMIGLFILYWLIESIRQKQAFQNIVKTLGAVVLALIIGAAMSSWLYLSVQEYAHYSIRGGTTGLDYNYATNWSFSPLEITTFFVPSFLGFGGQTYWGAMPFTDYPLYMGIVTLLLAGMALMLKRDRYVIFFTILALVALIVSFGKHLPILYGPLFKFLPFFNKFRVPTMIHILLEFAVVILAGLGLHALLNLKDSSLHQKIRKYIYVFGGVCGAFGLFLLFGKSAYLGLVAGSAKQLSAPAQALAYKKAASDGLKLIIILAVTGFSIIYFLRGKIKGNTLGGILIALLILDLWWVDFKIIAPKPKADEGKYFAENNAVQFLKKDPAPYRIFPVYDDKPDNWYMYHKIQNIRGYHAAKLKIYQTFLENTGLDQRDRFGFPPFLSKYLKVQFSNGQPSLQVIPLAQIPPARLQSDNAIMDMLNVKYLISYYPIPDPRYQTVLQNKPMVIENTRVLPRAFFVDKIKVISNKDEFFNYLKSGNFDPAKEAILEVEPRFDIEPSTNHRVQITSYDIHEIKLQAQVEKPALMVLSEIYYPAGWKAFVDGKESRIYKTNYILRSILLEPGSHEIKFVFSPKTFKLGLGITFILFIPLVVFCLVSLRRGKFTNRSRR
ncbi:MAG: YfhO family protein, partial [bacterium]